MESAFPHKFLKKIDKVGRKEIQHFVTNLLQEKDFLLDVLNAVTDGVFVTGPKGNITLINQAARQFFSLGSYNYNGLLIHEVLQDEQLQKFCEYFQEDHQEIQNREILVEVPYRRVFSVSVLPLGKEDDPSAPPRIVWLLSDRTEAWRRARESQQRDSIESMRTMTAGIAHEVKNPLNSLNIHAQLLVKAAKTLTDQSGSSPTLERLEKSSNILIEEIDRLKRVVDDFIEAVRPAQPDLRRDSINKVAISLAELVGPACNDKGISLALNLDPEIPPLIIDPEQMHQALLNIVKNAMEAIDQEEGQITLRTTLKSDHVLIDVTDNGCGIPEEERMKIFEPYHSTKFHGTGLGLVLVYQIVKAHRGALKLDSQEGRGTTFSIALPLTEKPIRMLTAQIDPESILSQKKESN